MKAIWKEDFRLRCLFKVETAARGHGQDKRVVGTQAAYGPHGIRSSLIMKHLDLNEVGVSNPGNPAWQACRDDLLDGARCINA